MIQRLALLLCLLPAAAFAEYKVAFGESDLTPDVQHHVTGPLLQLHSTGGTTLSFQHGSRFVIGKDNRITLLSGNMRVGPAGGDMLLLSLPQGPATVAPLTALTVTASAAQASGKVYQGQLTVADKTFQTGQGFVLTHTSAEATFTPAPAEAPQPTTIATKPTQGTPQTTEEQPTVPTPQPEPEIIPEPQPPEPQPEEEEEPQPAQPENPNIPTPQPEIPTTPQPEVPTQPQPQTPTAPERLDSNVTLNSMAISFNRNMSSAMAANTTHTSLVFDTFSDGTFAPNAILTSRFGTNTTRLMRGTAELAEWSSNNNVAGIARWVGGSQMVVKGAAVTEIANNNTTQTEEGPQTTPLSLHMVWGQTPTNIPQTGTLHYTLAAATQPTYTNGASSEGATFTGNLSLTFQQNYSGGIGHYSFNGEVTMPAQNADSTPTVYHLTNNTGNPTSFNAAAFANVSDLNVTSTPGAAACPTGSCTGSVNIAGFGNGMNTAGALYAINPNGPVGIEGAALFTASQP